MREKTCCFTGHRFIPANEREQIITKLERTIIELYRQGVVYYGAGGALGFDTIAADTIIRLRETYPKLRLILVLPCISQTAKWKNARDIEHYNQIKELADKVTYTSLEYTADCMLRRNDHLVDGSSVCICYKTKNRGGTAYTVNYAHQQGLQVINLAE